MIQKNPDVGRKEEGMMNVRKLKAAIAESGKLKGDLAEALGTSRSTFSAKINGHREFSFKEAEALCQLLGIDSAEEKVKIFFAP